MINQEILKLNYSYDEKTGVFTRLVSNNHRYKIGQITSGTMNGHGYLKLTINKKSYLCHRLAWLYKYGHWPNNHLDHINGIKTDNRICNLREATIQQNNFNKKVRIDNKLQAKGIYLIEKTNKYCVRGTIDGKRLHIGHFDNIDDAKKAYENFSKKYHGEFGRAE